MMRATKGMLLATGLAGFILLGMAQSIFGPILPVYAQHFNLPVAAVSWLLSAFWAGCLGGVIAVYLFPDLLGPKSGLAAAALGTMLMALLADWGLVLLGGAVFGFGYGVIAAVYNPRILAAFGSRGPALVSLVNAIFTLGAIAAPMVFVALNRNPAVVFWAFAAYAGVVLVVATAMGDTRIAQQTSSAPLRLNWMILGFAMFGIGMESSLVGLGPTALMIAGLGEDAAASLLSQFFAAYLAARLSLVVLAPRVAPFKIYLSAMMMTLVLSLATIAGDAAVWFPLMGFGCGVFFHGAYLTGLTLMGASTRVSAILLAAGITGAIVQPMIIAQVLESLGPKGFFQIVFGLSAIVTLVGLTLGRSLLRR